MSDAIRADVIDAPDGFEPIDAPAPFLHKNGPLFVSHEGSTFRLGMFVSPEHCNPRGDCHGGWLATLMDAQLPLCGMHAIGLPRASVATVSMSLDYLAPVPSGSWIEGSAMLLRRTSRLMFLQGTLRVDGEPVLRGSGVWRVFS